VETQAQKQEVLSTDDTRSDFVDEAKGLISEMDEAIARVEADGGTVEVATPEAVAGAILENEEARKDLGIPDNVEAQPEQEHIDPAAAEGKRVLSVSEQREMSAAELKELIISGEVVLAQDIAPAAQ
jgi:hypothetical protein